MDSALTLSDTLSARGQHHFVRNISPKSLKWDTRGRSCTYQKPNFCYLLTASFHLLRGFFQKHYSLLQLCSLSVCTLTGIVHKSNLCRTCLISTAILHRKIGQFSGATLILNQISKDLAKANSITFIIKTFTYLIFYSHVFELHLLYEFVLSIHRMPRKTNLFFSSLMSSLMMQEEADHPVA